MHNSLSCEYIHSMYMYINTCTFSCENVHVFSLKMTHWYDLSHVLIYYTHILNPTAVLSMAIIERIYTILLYA